MGVHAAASAIGERILAPHRRSPRSPGSYGPPRTLGRHGYPDRLPGTEIPLGARVIAACDAYESMTSDRCYRSARSPDAALAELRRCEGSSVRSEVVRVRRRLIERAGAGAPGGRSIDRDDAGRKTRPRPQAGSATVAYRPTCSARGGLILTKPRAQFTAQFGRIARDSICAAQLIGTERSGRDRDAAQPVGARARDVPRGVADHDRSARGGRGPGAPARRRAIAGSAARSSASEANAPWPAPNQSPSPARSASAGRPARSSRSPAPGGRLVGGQPLQQARIPSITNSDRSASHSSAYARAALERHVVGASIDPLRGYAGGEQDRTRDLAVGATGRVQVGARPAQRRRRERPQAPGGARAVCGGCARQQRAVDVEQQQAVTVGAAAVVEPCMRGSLESQDHARTRPQRSAAARRRRSASRLLDVVERDHLDRRVHVTQGDRHEAGRHAASG